MSQDRMALQKQIADLDRQMNDEVARHGKSARLDVRSVNFPFSYYVVTLCFLAWWMFGGMLHSDLHGLTGEWSFFAGVVLGLLTALATVKWIGRKAKGTKAYDHGESEKIVALRKQRDDLKKKLEAINKADGKYENPV